MTAGIPGSGIGGLFYLVCAFLMPFHELVSVCTGKSNHTSRRKVVRQVINAAGVLCGVWLTGWFISRAVRIVAVSMHVSLPRVAPALHFINLTCGLFTLLWVILTVQVLGITYRKLQSRDTGITK
jgi:fucose permease